MNTLNQKQTVELYQHLKEHEEDYDGDSFSDIAEAASEVVGFTVSPRNVVSMRDHFGFGFGAKAGRKSKSEELQPILDEIAALRQDVAELAELVLKIMSEEGSIADMQKATGIIRKRNSNGTGHPF